MAEAVRMTDYQVAVIVSLRAQPGYVFSETIDGGVEVHVARRMVHQGWLVDIGGNRFAITHEGMDAFRATIGSEGNSIARAVAREESGKTFRVVFKRGINVEVRKEINPRQPSKREVWRFCEGHEYWVAAVVSQENDCYTLYLINSNLSMQYPDRIVNVPADAFEVVEAKALVR